MIAQASDDIIKVVPKMKTRSIDLAPELTEANLGFTLIHSIYTEFHGRWSGWSLNLVTSNLNL